jgi:phosphate transport system substrate-binding protein
MMNKLKLVLCIAAVVILGGACKQKQEKTTTPPKANIKKATFVADESCEPIADELLYVFNQSYDNTEANIIYKSENDVLRLFLDDKIRLALLSRELNVQELKKLKQKNLAPETYRFAIDAIAIIVNKASNDTLITVNEIKKMLNGKTKTDKNIVFDNPSSSLVRYLKEFSGNSELKGKNIFALKNNKEVVKYVSEHEDAIGIIGYNWLYDPYEDDKNPVNGVKVLAVKDENSKLAPNQYFKPSQSTLALKQYPLSRNLYVVNNTGKKDLGTNFAYFILSENGQRVILRSNVLPDKIPGREINIKHTF